MNRWFTQEETWMGKKETWGDAAPFHRQSGRHKLKPQGDAISHLPDWQKLVNLIKPSIGEDVGRGTLILLVVG